MPSTSATLAASRKSCRDEQYSSSSSSSQFFMKIATTSWPSRLSRCADTAESTPPDKPTTTRCFCADAMRRIVGIGAGLPDLGVVERRVAVHQVERIALARGVVLDALQDQRAAVPVAARPHLVERHPQGAHDAGVERARRIRLAGRAAEGHAQV